MYVPRHFAAPGVEAMRAVIRNHPLATLVTLGTEGLEATHVPLYLHPDPAPHGALWGHVARANPMWTRVRPEVEALAVFHGPDAYISPSWYATKRETGKVVPTWNYVVVHARGHLRVIDDAAWLREQIERLTAHNEAGLPEPWAVDDAPAEFIDAMVQAIVGLELVMTGLDGKWKASQNHPERNRAGVIAGLRARGAAARAMADCMAEVAPPGDAAPDR